MFSQWRKLITLVPQRQKTNSSKMNVFNSSDEKGLKLKRTSGSGSRVAPRYAALPKSLLALGNRRRAATKLKEAAESSFPSKFHLPKLPDNVTQKIMSPIPQPENILPPPKYLKITQVKSAIQLGKSMQDSMSLLGFDKSTRVVYKEPSAIIVGLCVKLRYLLKIERADSIPEITKPKSGFEVLGKYVHPWVIKANASNRGKGPFI